MGARRIDVTWYGKAGTFGLMIAFPLFLASHSTLGWADTAGCWPGWPASQDWSSATSRSSRTCPSASKALRGRRPVGPIGRPRWGFDDVKAVIMAGGEGTRLRR